MSTLGLHADNPNNPSMIWNDFPLNTALVFEVDSGTTRFIYGAVKTNLGGTFNLPATQLSDPSLYSFSPQVGIITGGPNVVAAWISVDPITGKRAIYAISYQDPSGWMFPATLISDVTDDVLPDYKLSVALVFSNNMAVVWRTIDNSGNVVLKIRNGTFPNTWDLTSTQLSP